MFFEFFVVFVVQRTLLRLNGYQKSTLCVLGGLCVEKLGSAVVVGLAVLDGAGAVELLQQQRAAQFVWQREPGQGQ